MDIFCKVTETGFTPLYDDDYEAKKRLKIGSNVRCRITRPRNLKFHKKFMALLRITLDNLPESVQKEKGIYNIDTMLAAVKLDMGYFETITVAEQEITRLQSISFAKMSEDDFGHFYNIVVADILLHYLKGTDPTALRQEVEDFIGRGY